MAMRVLHVAPLISSRGEYGGPTSVMQQQTNELRRRGHSVTIAAPVRPSDRDEIAQDPTSGRSAPVRSRGPASAACRRPL